MSIPQVRVAVVSSWELVRTGLGSLLEEDLTIDVVDVSADDGHLDGPDVIVYLHTGDAGHRPSELRHLIRSTGRVLLLLPPGVDLSDEQARAMGAVGTLSIQADRTELVRAVRTAAACDPRPVHSGQPSLLSDRQLAFVELVATGLSNQEIADRLRVSLNTVKTTLRVAYERIGVNSRAKAAAWYHRGAHHQPSP